MMHGYMAFDGSGRLLVPFRTWRNTVTEEAAFMNFHALMLNPELKAMQQALLDRHYLRKHGENAYYGQDTSK